MKRISFNVTGKVYNKIKAQLSDTDESVNTATKAMLYAMAGEPLELTSKEVARLESIRERKEKLAELEKELLEPRDIPENPFAEPSKYSNSNSNNVNRDTRQPVTGGIGNIRKGKVEQPNTPQRKR